MQYAAPIVHPNVTADQFSIYPTWMDIDNLVPGNATTGIQTAALNDVLLAATAWAANFCDGMPLHAHLDTRQGRTYADRFGRLHLHPAHIPVRWSPLAPGGGVLAMSYGPDPTLLTADTIPDGSIWVEDGRQVTFTITGGTQFFQGPAIQFGGRLPTPNLVTFYSWTYLAGYVNTLISAPCTAAASSIQVSDPTGILPGNVLRIWDDIHVASEAVYVAASYVPVQAWPPVPTSIPLATPTQFAHVAQVGITDMPRDMLQAVVMYSVGLLMREDVAGTDPFAGSVYGPSVRRDDARGAGGGLITE